MADDRFDSYIAAGAERLEASLGAEAPALAMGGLAWLRSLTRTGRLADYFRHPNRFPVLRLPWWAVESAAAEPSCERPDLVGDITYGSMAGYYYIRLIDDLVDHDPGVSLDLLPLAAFFHTEFHGIYHRHFPPDSEFWPVFRTRWLRLADAMVARIEPGADPAESLLRRATATIGAVVIPLRALTLGFGVPERFPRWEPVVLELARIEQLIDDLVDWQVDLERDLPNLLLVEGVRRARHGEPVAAWVVREGYGWGLEAAGNRISALHEAAAAFDSPSLLEFLALRQAFLRGLETETGPGRAAFAALAKEFGANWA